MKCLAARSTSQAGTKEKRKEGRKKHVGGEHRQCVHSIIHMHNYTHTQTYRPVAMFMVQLPTNFLCFACCVPYIMQHSWNRACPFLPTKQNKTSHPHFRTSIQTMRVQLFLWNLVIISFDSVLSASLVTLITALRFSSAW